MDGNITTEEDNETNMAKRISIKDIYSHAGNAKGDESLAMLKDKEDRKEADVAAAAAKKDQAKDKRAKDTFALVLTGSEILTRLEQLGSFCGSGNIYTASSAAASNSFCSSDPRERKYSKFAN